MRGATRNLWKAGIAMAGMLLLLLLIPWIPVSAAGAEVRVPGSATPITVQATPTVDATVTALNKEKLEQEVQQLQQSNHRGLGDWLWSNAAGVLSGFLSTLVVVIGALIGFWQWRVSRKDAQHKEDVDRKAAQTKELEDREAERDRRAEERFQSAVEGLSSEREEAKVGAAILLRTFLRPGYKEFYTQTFDLAVAHLCPTRTSNPPEDPMTPLPLTILRQALIVVFKEAFPLVRSQYKESPQSLDGSYIQLDSAYLVGADLKQVWMPQASLRNADLSRAKLIEANLNEAKLNGARLYMADLSRAALNEADLSGSYLLGAILNEADLNEADLTRATLGSAYLERAKLNGARLNGAELNGARLNEARLNEARLSGAKLILAKLNRADLGGADLGETQLGGAQFFKANLSGAYLYKANFSGADLGEADLSRADLSGANIEDAKSLKGTNLREVKGLTEEQKASCKAKGAIIDEDATTDSPQPTVTPALSPQSSNAQTPPAPAAQGSTPTPSTDDSSDLSSQPDPAA